MFLIQMSPSPNFELKHFIMFQTSCVLKYFETQIYTDPDEPFGIT